MPSNLLTYNTNWSLMNEEGRRVLSRCLVPLFCLDVLVCSARREKVVGAVFLEGLQLKILHKKTSAASKTEMELADTETRQDSRDDKKRNSHTKRQTLKRHADLVSSSYCLGLQDSNFGCVVL
jgi:hypothetical protein